VKPLLMAATATLGLSFLLLALTPAWPTAVAGTGAVTGSPVVAGTTVVGETRSAAAVGTEAASWGSTSTSASSATHTPARTRSSVLIVEVTPEQGPRIVIPVPYAILRAGLALAPRDIRQMAIPELAPHADDFERIVDVLQEAPDGVFIQIESPNEQVTVSKEAGAIRVAVLDRDDTQVHAALPLALLASARHAFDQDTGTLRTGALARALRDTPRGPLVHVVDGGTEVKVRAW